MAQKTARVAILLVGLLGCFPATTPAADAPGVRVPEGFEVTLYADDDLAPDIYSMTLDAKGRVVVSGAGYVRILTDENGDGTADAFKQFADGPRTGAQGMYFDGPDLYCVGDAGVILYHDKNGDDRADDYPTPLLPIKTGGEHHAHSIQRGPDGWWYLIAGNYAGVTASSARSPTSPIKQPAAGVLMRMKPDLSGTEVVADGYRNAYDFAFNDQGDVFTYDSDGERDVSLPWYRPTRVFHMLPASNAGWVSRSWKRPDEFPDMPPVLARLGRGSPTGVTCYRHDRFPAPYRGALFVCDWTFGRVVALPMDRAGAVYQSKPIEFMTGVGQFGFAPSDIEVGPDGCLFVSVGGRGTRGGVYRVRYVGDNAGQVNKDVPPRPRSRNQKLTACLDAPQPLSSWSRAVWLPLARSLGRDAIHAGALDADRPPRQRIRAIEILTEQFGGLDTEAIETLARDESAAVRARTAWAVGRVASGEADLETLLPFLADEDPLVARFALEALLTAEEGAAMAKAISALRHHLDSPDRWLGHTAARVLLRLSREDLERLRQPALTRRAGVRAGFALRSRFPNSARLEARFVKEALASRRPEDRLDALRMMQVFAGDLGPGKHPPVFDGYKCPQAANAALLADVKFPTGDRRTDREVSRLVAMSGLSDTAWLDRVLALITRDSHPTDDVHYLIVAARNRCERTDAHRAAIARALVELDAKIAGRTLHVDSNWEPRIGELYRELVRLDPQLPAAVIRQDGFGRADHMIFVDGQAKAYQQQAAARFAAQIKKDREYAWTSDVVALLARFADESDYEKLIRAQYENLAVRDSVLAMIARGAGAEDRPKLVAGLESAETHVLSAVTEALLRLPPAREADEPVALVRTLRRLGRDKSEYPIKEKVVMLLRRNSGRTFGYELGGAGYRPQNDAVNRWTAWLREQYPRESAALAGNDLTAFRAQLAGIDWDGGDAARGKRLFARHACARCHGGLRSLGPDLAGVARRFSRDDIFTAIADPNRDVSPRYQTTMIETITGQTYRGLIIYQSVDGVTLRDSQTRTLRIEADTIARRGKSASSLMPEGLLKGLGPGEIADLYAYLKRL